MVGTLMLTISKCLVTHSLSAWPVSAAGLYALVGMWTQMSVMATSA